MLCVRSQQGGHAERDIRQFDSAFALSRFEETRLDLPYLAMRSFERLVPIWVNTAEIWPDDVTV